jgi:ornithine cyclodeaminase/alanine dehydrogenase-like protein (mu-crystallin family)
VNAPEARWLSDAQVAGLLPAPLAAAELARSVLVGLAEGTIELPPKPAIHPRADAFVNTMPAYVGSLDGSGVKLVSVFPGNRERGLPAISAIVIVLDSETGLVRGLLGATALTACRTAAASAACAARLAPAAPGHVAITGAGVEARTHVLALEAQGYGEIVVWDHRASNIKALRAWAAEHAPSVTISPAESASAAAEGAAIVVTGIPIGAEGGRVDPAALRPDVLALPIDYSTSIAAETANGAALLLSDDVAQLDGYRGAHWKGWRPLDGPVGSWLADGAPPRPEGQVVVANLGVGAHDVVFGMAVLERAEREGIGELVSP